MFTVVEVIPYKTFKERIRLLRINKTAKLCNGYITIERRVGWQYDDRI